MNRRELLKNSAVLAIAGIIAPGALTASPVKRTNISRAKPNHQFRIGKIEATIISDGHVFMNEIQPNFAPGASGSDVKAVLEENFASTSSIDIAVNVLLLKFQNRVILMDTGCGYNFGTNSGWLVSNLINSGIRPESVTDIVITHAHSDHIGGYSDERGNVIFKNADVYLSKADHDFWMAPKPDFSKSRLTKNENDKIVFDIAVAKKNILLANHKLHLFNDGDVLLDCLKMNLAPGHTPGHTVVQLFSDGQELYHIVDIVHSDILPFDNPDWGVNSDVDYDLAIRTRKKFLTQLAESRALSFAYHLPWPGLGHVRKRDDGFEWVQKTSSVPD